jgi:S-adenosylmethionine decarboxylase
LKNLGKHCVAELYGCDHSILDNEKVLIELIRESIDIAGATLLDICSHKFEPQGVTIVALLSESHISIHTWPEDGSVALDVFTCGNSKPHLALLHIINSLNPTKYSMNCFDRG